VNVGVAPDGSVLVHGNPGELLDDVGLQVAKIAADAATARLEKVPLHRAVPNRDDKRLPPKTAREALRAHARKTAKRASWHADGGQSARLAPIIPTRRSGDQCSGRVTWPPTTHDQRDDGYMPASTAPRPLRVQLLHVVDCPHTAVADIRLRVALNATGHDDTPIEWVLVSTVEQAERIDFHGSPTVLLNGHDPFTTRDLHVGLACRPYASDGGPTDAPTIEQLVDAVLLAQTPVESGPTVEV